MKFYNPVQIINHKGARSRLYDVCKKETLVICTETALERLKLDAQMTQFLGLPGLLFEHTFSSNPSLADMSKISEKYASSEINAVVGLGGGSTLDVAKIVAVSVPAFRNGLTLRNLLDDSSLLNNVDPLNCYLVPTTAGTGSEVTPFATVWDYVEQQKKSLSHPKMFANHAYVDPDFLLGVPLSTSLSTGLDALNQAFESIWNKNANEISLMFAVRAACLSLKYLPLLENVGSSDEIDLNLSRASLFAGLAISHTRTAICHSISYPLTLEFHIPHGFACIFSMLDVYDFNSDLVSTQLEEIERYIGKDPRDAISELFDQYDLTSIFQRYVHRKKDVLSIIDSMVSTGRFENNIKSCSPDMLKKIINLSCDRFL